METTTNKRPPNPYRVPLAAWRRNNGLDDDGAFFEALGELVHDCVAPALCRDGCEVEPDGRCEHGCPSVLLATGLI